jgi:hypothetical protein
MKAPSLFLLLSAGLAVGQVVPLNRAQLHSDMDANAKRITNAPAPIAAGDLVNKAYVDGISNALFALIGGTSPVVADNGLTGSGGVITGSGGALHGSSF